MVSEQSGEDSTNGWTKLGAQVTAHDVNRPIAYRKEKRNARALQLVKRRERRPLHQIDRSKETPNLCIGISPYFLTAFSLIFHIL